MTEFADEEVVYCQWHSKTETVLRCYQCEAPICVRCAQRTPVGYICPNCRKGRRQRFNQVRRTDYVIAAVVSLILGTIAGFLPRTGFWLAVIFISPLAGGLIAEAVWRLVGRRYGEHLWWIVAAGIVIGALIVVLPPWLVLLLAGQEVIALLLFDLLWLGLHLALAVGAATARLRLR